MENEFDIKRYIELLSRERRLFSGIAFAVMLAAVIACYVIPKKFSAASTVFIEKSAISELVRGLAVVPTVEDKIKGLTYAMSSRPLLMQVIEELDVNLKKRSPVEMEEFLNELQKHTTIKTRDREGLFIVSFTSDDPVFARDYVNTLVRKYIEQNLSSKRDSSYDATKFISEQADTFKEKIKKIDDEIERVRREKAIYLASDEGALMQENAAAQQRLEDLRIRRANLEAQRATYKKNDPYQARVRDLQKRLESLRQQYTENYPEVSKVRSELDDAIREQQQSRVGRSFAHDNPELERIEIELSTIRSAEDAQRRVIGSNNGLLRGIPSAKAEMLELQKQKDSQKVMYDQLINRQGQSEVSKQIEVQDKATTFRIVDPAVLPLIPDSPKRVKIMLLGLIGGIAAGFGMLVLKEQFNKTIRTVDTLKSLGFTVLAVIPKINNPEELLLQRRQNVRLYIFSGIVLTLFLGNLVLEIIGYSVVDKIVNLFVT